MKQRLVQMPHYFVSIFFEVILFCLFVPIYEQTANVSSQDGYKYFFFFLVIKLKQNVLLWGVVLVFCCSFVLFVLFCLPHLA